MASFCFHRAEPGVEPGAELEAPLVHGVVGSTRIRAQCWADDRVATARYGDYWEVELSMMVDQLVALPPVFSPGLEFRTDGRASVLGTAMPEGLGAWYIESLDASILLGLEPEEARTLYPGRPTGALGRLDLTRVPGLGTSDPWILAEIVRGKRGTYAEAVAAIRGSRPELTEDEASDLLAKALFDTR